MVDALQKLQLLGRAARYEPAEEVSMTGRRWPSARVPEELVDCISYAVTPKGRVPMLKTLLSSACERDCYYCPFRSGRDFCRATFQPDDLAKLFLQLYQNDLVQGVFVSSGLVGGGPDTQDRILATAEILRKRYRFPGYIHLKIMPGAERDQVAAGMSLADRVSVNLEAPNDKRLARLAPHKTFTEELLQRMQWVEAFRQSHGERGPSMTTQFVVGAAGESDLELLHTTAYLYKHLRLARAYFSGFNPIEDTPLADLPPASIRREHRLYQASFLLRDYGFDIEELPVAQDGNLPLHADPKLLWARQHLADAPVEINRADRETLLRVPGIGVKSADRIIAARRDGALRDLSHLRQLHIPAARAAPFILLAGKRPAHQLPLPL